MANETGVTQSCQKGVCVCGVCGVCVFVEGRVWGMCMSGSGGGGSRGGYVSVGVCRDL